MQELRLHRQTSQGTSNFTLLLFTWSSGVVFTEVSSQLAAGMWALQSSTGCPGEGFPLRWGFALLWLLSVSVVEFWCFISGYLKGTLFCPASTLHHHADFPRGWFCRRESQYWYFSVRLVTPWPTPLRGGAEDCSTCVNGDNRCKGKIRTSHGKAEQFT